MSEPRNLSAPAKPDAWQNDGENPSTGDLSPSDLSPSDLAERLGVVRHVSESYSVGDFRYTSLTDAIAQARRMATLEQELLA